MGGCDRYDGVIIASLSGLDVIREELRAAGIPESKIITDYVLTRVEARINFLNDYADMVKEIAWKYAVAEGGVFQGEFSKIINKCFPDSELYLFDTFEGFDERDLVLEEKNSWSAEVANHLGETSAELVMSKLPHPEKAVIRKGYFPETANGLEDKNFIFVNLDFDLYQPTLDGIRFFYPRVAKGGVILIHDYYNEGYRGVKEAVATFEKESGFELLKMPIGDHCSIGVIVH